MSWICKSCEAQNEDHFSFCEVCDSPRPIESSVKKDNVETKIASAIYRSPTSITTKKKICPKSIPRKKIKESDDILKFIFSLLFCIVFGLKLATSLGIVDFKKNKTPEVTPQTIEATAPEVVPEPTQAESIEKKSSKSKLDDYFTIAVEAISQGDTAKVKKIIEKTKGEVLHHRDEKGISLIFYAVGGNKIAETRYLLKQNVNVYETDSLGNSLDEYVNNETIALMLFNYRNRDSLALISTMNNDTALLSELLDFGVDVNAKDKNGTPLIHWAVKGGSEVFELLEKRGADIKAVNTYNETVLFVAVRENNYEFVRKLLEKGVSAFDENTFSETPMTVADNDASLLVKHYTYRDDYFADVAEKGLVDSAEYFLKLGADINKFNSKTGKTAMHSAVSNDDVRMLRLLNQYDANMRLKQGGFTPTEIAMQKGCKNAFDYLISLDDSLLREKVTSGSLMHFAVLTDDSSWVGKLVHLGMDVDVINDAGKTPLQIALQKKKYTMLVALLSHGADVNRKDGNGNMPIHIASIVSDSLSIATLVEYGADPKVKNANEEEPIDIAKKNENSSAESALSEYYFFGRMKKNGARFLGKIKSFFE